MRVSAFPARLGAAALIAATALGLSACGSATVEDTGASATVAPLERASASAAPSAEHSALTSADPSTTRASTEPSTPADAEKSRQAEPEDRGAREISEIPAPAGPQGVEQDYLRGVAAAGVDVAGVEDQLIGAAQTVCHEDTVTVGAVAGQLIEQGRTQLGHPQVIALLTDQAKMTICSG